ncbi:MAG: SH3 domain-containing protein [Christensenellales bacterium]
MRGGNRADRQDAAGTGWACIATSIVGREADEDTTADVQAGTEYIVCAQKGLRMRKKPDIRGEYMQMLPDGAVITVLEEQAGWFKTTYKGYPVGSARSIAAKPRGND